MKAMDYQLQNIKEQANDIENHFKRADRELQAFDEHLKNEKNRIFMISRSVPRSAKISRWRL